MQNAWGKQVETLVSRSKHTDVYNLEGSSKQFLEKKQCPSLGFRGVSLLHPNIRIHFLHNLLHKFPLLLTRRICLTIKSFPHDLNEAFSCITVRKIFKLVTKDLKGSCSIILDWPCLSLNKSITTKWSGKNWPIVSRLYAIDCKPTLAGQN